MSNKIIVVTGSNKGIGLEIVRGIAKLEKNAKIILTARHQNLAEKAIEELKRKDGITNVTYELLDLKSRHSIQHFVKILHEKYGRVDVLFNNAGCLDPSFNLTPEIVEHILQTNFFGLVELSEGLIPLLSKAPDARIINTGSRAGNLNAYSKALQEEYLAATTTRQVFELAYAFESAAKHNDVLKLGYAEPKMVNTAYGVSKSLVHAYTTALSKEHPEILSLSYCPGPIDTDMAKQAGLDKSGWKIGTPTQGADTALFLATESRSKLENGAFYTEREKRSKVDAPFVQF